MALDVTKLKTSLPLAGLLFTARIIAIAGDKFVGFNGYPYMQDAYFSFSRFLFSCKIHFETTEHSKFESLDDSDNTGDQIMMSHIQNKYLCFCPLVFCLTM